MSSLASSIRYEHLPVLQSVCAYGSETLVPDNDLCRLSYYLKCCVVGCGINIGIDDALLDYMNAHQLTIEQQQQILRYAFSDLGVFNLMNRAFILDDQHVLLPQGTLNTFFEFKTASTYFSIDTFTVATGQQVYVHKVMLCTIKWMREYYIDPFVRYQQGNPMIEIYATPVAEDDEVSYAVGGDDYCHQGMVVTPILDHRGVANNLLFRTCCTCLETIHMNESPSYRCTQCPAAELCEDCYNAGRHDQTHTFERYCRTSAEYLSARVETLHEDNMSFIPDVPIAIAIPIDQNVPAEIFKTSELVAKAICDTDHSKTSGRHPKRKRRRSSSISPFDENIEYTIQQRNRKPFTGRPAHGRSDNAGGVATSE